MTDSAVPHVTLLDTSARVAPGLLTASAWDLVRAVPVRCGDPGHRLIPVLRDAGVETVVLDVTRDSVLPALRQAAADAGADGVVWLLAPRTPWPVPSDAIDAYLRAHAASEPGAVRVLEAAHGLPGSALLDAVAVMDRLRSPGGCPWDGEQTHQSLAPYLLEEAYEAYEALEDADPAALREELGDVLMQILFHARIAAEATDGEAGSGGSRFDVDEVARVLVEKLVRRHPHVFGDLTVSGADEVVTNWDAIKAVEKGRRSVTEGVPLGQPALSLAAKLQKRARKAGVPADLVVPRPLGAGESRPLSAALETLAHEPPLTETAIGDLLFAAVALAAKADIDPEAALRGRARAFRDRLAAAEETSRTDGVEPSDQDSEAWRSRWPTA